MNELPKCKLCRRIPTLRPDGKTYRHGNDCPASGVYTVAEWLLVHGPLLARAPRLTPAMIQALRDAAETAGQDWRRAAIRAALAALGEGQM